MNKRNLQKELEIIINESEALGVRPKLLLHACCAPCSSHCMEYLNKYFDITIYFYNPNIDNSKEYNLRVEEEKRLIDELDLPYKVGFMEGEYEPKRFHELVKGHERDKEGGERCHICYEMRLLDTADRAKKNGFDYFATSLSISPMKNSQVLCEIGEKVGSDIGIKYLPSDFKKKNGYKRSVELSNEHDLYRQNYCGCSFSKRESEERLKSVEK